MVGAHTEPHCTANDHVNNLRCILIDGGTSGAVYGRIRELRQKIPRVRSFGVDTASRPVEIGALLAPSRGKRLLSRVVLSQSVFFLETRARYTSAISTIRQRVPRRPRGAPRLGLGRENTPGH